MRHGFLHHTGRLNDLRKEHFTVTKQVTHHIHAVHEWPLNHLNGATAGRFNLLANFLGVLNDVTGHAMHHGMNQTLTYRLLTPSQILFLA